MNGSDCPKSNERGAALVIAMMVLLVLVVTSAALVTTSIVNTKLSGQDQQRARALDLAEAGVAEAVSRIKTGDVPANTNPKMVAQIFLTNAGSVPALGTDSTGLATAQPAGNWLNYTTATRGPDVLTVQYKTDGARSAVMKYDQTKSLPVNATTGMPIYEITSTGTVGTTSRTILADVCFKPFLVNMKGALATNQDVQFTGNAWACGYNHDVSTPAGTGVNGRFGAGGCDENPAQLHWEVGTGDLTGIWSTGAINSGGAANDAGNPPEQAGQAGFFTGPWDCLGLSQAEFWSLAGPPQNSVPANLDNNIYLDNDAVTQNQSGSFILHGTGSGLLYIDGDATFNAGFTYRGLIYVEGDCKINGTAWVLGGMVVKGKTQVKFNGGATILYSADAISQNISRHGGSVSNLAWREIPQQ